MLKLSDIKTYYGNIQALKGVSIDISEGEIITLIGANGAGKSTTLMSISGIVPPRTGEIHFLGNPIHAVSPDQIVQMGICQVPEGRRIFPYLSVSENLDMGAFLRNDKEGIKQDMEHIFELFPILAQRRNQAGGTLSGGEQQMLAISRALMAKPKLLLLDEPSLGLAPLVIRQIFEIIRKITRESNKRQIFSCSFLDSVDYAPHASANRRGEYHPPASCPSHTSANSRKKVAELPHRHPTYSLFIVHYSAPRLMPHHIRYNRMQKKCRILPATTKM